MPPSSDALYVDTEGGGLIDVPRAVGGHDDDARALDEPVRLCRGAAKPFQNGALSWEQRNFRRGAGHLFGMIRIKANGNPCDFSPAALGGHPDLPAAAQRQSGALRGTYTTSF